VINSNLGRLATVHYTSVTDDDRPVDDNLCQTPHSIAVARQKLVFFRKVKRLKGQTTVKKIQATEYAYGLSGSMRSKVETLLLAAID